MLPKGKRVSRELWKSAASSRAKSLRSHSSNHFFLRVSSSPDKNARIAVSVSKKAAKKAVDRNRMRRRAYAAAASILPWLKPNLYLLSARPGAGEAKGEELKAELLKLFASGGHIVSGGKKD